MAIATGQITIMDFNDAITLTGYISSNHNKSVKYDGDNEAYNPDFPTSPLVLTPSLFKAGSATDLMASGTNIKSVTWKRKANNQTGENDLSAGESVGVSFPKTLTVSSQPFGPVVFSVEYICTIVYTDPTTNLDLTYKNSVTFNKVTDGNNIAIAEITADPGFVFKNKLPSSLTLSAKLFRGATPDLSDLTYQWQEIVGSTWTDMAGETSVDLVVSQGDVPSQKQYRVVISDTVRGDNYISDPATVLDFNDPIDVIPFSSNGIIFKNGIISTDITAKCFQNGVEIDVAGTEYTYTWTKIDKDGNASAFGTGKTKSVGSADIYAKATFSIDID